jgi:hypothetical protein
MWLAMDAAGVSAAPLSMRWWRTQYRAAGGNCCRGCFRKMQQAALLKSAGFREVGTYEKHAKLDGQWRDVVIVEKFFG